MKTILLSICFFTAMFAFGQAIEPPKDSLIAEKINAWKIRGKYMRYETLCSRMFTIKLNHQVKYRGGCEANKDTRKKGRWPIQNDTLIVTGLFGERQEWILYKGCLYNVTSVNNNYRVACRRKQAEGQ